MRILFCTNSLGARGGIERVTIVKANAFAEIPGNEVAICYTDKGTYPEDTIHPVSGKVRVIDTGVPFWDLYPLNLKNLLVTAPKKLLKLRKSLKRIIKDFKPDVVITTGSYEKYALATLSPSRIAGKPSVKVREYHFNSNYRKFTGDSRLFKIAEWFEYNVLGRMFDMNYLLTKEDKDSNFKHNPKFDYLYNPVSFSHIEMSDTKRENIVIAVNRLVDQKNTTDIIKAWGRIQNKAIGWKLLIVGDGPERKMLQELANNLGVGDTVHFLGFRKDIPELLSKSKILAMASKYEGMPLNLLETIVMGVVPISYRTPYGPADIITDGKDGILVDYMDEKQFADKLLRLIKDDACIKNMSIAAKERAKDFDVNKIAGEWMEKYRSLLDK